ncbi:CDP-diacylglycerol--serine O-phosphatidyltransferase [Kibdelosporangium phytohabitans]|uniref:CDP-diacylglycerol--serine O-phosphatidyltransferase n=1 Tax=Kibdelosporangium phytohabitans TaxID=860235 RepID=A0A0N7F2J1_9PSEU|nr:CDP-diacylglycerol--serine O-phosphatidyltransferase [Kibdelosporangium phytohabitans]ALG05975.1 phosphatidylserine synthase [Kibdelosporangium phytohabitans]MBE1465966.1 CDP-diacylglycerol--serine O-phosphatidyltransferase [Kibdelosporangium phytohabitans]
MAARTAPGVRLLPNAITVLAMCAGLSAVQFALHGNYEAVLASIFAAAILDSLDGRIARLLDATSKMGAELDSLSDAIAFGVAPALVLYQWKLGEDANRLGWIFALVFAVCMILRLARFNTLLDDTNQPPYAKEFFVGVPAPAGGMLALLPMIVWLEFDRAEGWWTDQRVVMVWAVAVAALLISRIPTLSVKTVRVPPRMVVPVLVSVTALAAAVVTYPIAALGIFLIVYLLHIPYAVRRKHWLAHHPEAWDVPPRERRAIRSQARRLGLRPPLRRRVAGVARRVRIGGRRPDENEQLHPGWQSYQPPEQQPRVLGPTPKRRSWRRIGLRRQPRPPRDR